MPTRTVYHTVPPPAGAGWLVMREGKATPVDRAQTKEVAIELGRQLAKEAALGQLIIHRQDGTIETEYTYGEGPECGPG